MGSALSLLTIMRQAENRKTTLSSKERLFHVLASHVMRQYRLPFSATESSQGESVSPDDQYENKLSIGLIPYQTLGLPESLAHTGSGSLWLYVVPYRFVREDKDIQALLPVKEDIGETYSFCSMQSDVLNFLAPKIVFSSNIHPSGSHRDSVICALIECSSEEERHKLMKDPDFFKKYAENNPKMVHWITRDHLLSFYAHTNCYPPR